MRYYNTALLEVQTTIWYFFTPSVTEMVDVKCDVTGLIQDVGHEISVSCIRQIVDNSPRKALGLLRQAIVDMSIYQGSTPQQRTER